MTLPVNHQQLVAEANRRTEEYKAKMKQVELEALNYEFAKLGPYIPSEETKAQLRRLDEMQREADEFVANCDWVIGGSTTKT